MPTKRWLILTAAGCAFVVVAMLVGTLAAFDKQHFGWMVGTWFLPLITSGVLVGSVVMLVGAWNLPARKTWRGIVLIVWALIALTSPAFGFLFLAPWCVLALMLPLVIAIFIQVGRSSLPAPAPRWSDSRGTPTARPE